VSAPERNLVLVHSAGWQDRADFVAIKALVEARAPDIEVFIAANDIRSSVTRKQASRRPTLVFSPIRLLAFQPLRGKVYAGTPMSKLDEMRQLAGAGLPVPRFEPIEPATRLSRDTYGPLVVIKPSYMLASWGQGVELRRTETVRYRGPDEFPDWHPGRHAPMIAQKFVDCGFPMTCRVLACFGRPVFTYCRESTRPLALPDHKDEFEQSEFMPSPPDRRAYVSRDPDILALAAQAFAAMPHVALQACDILRAKSGELFLLEVNPGGGTWMFSSPNAHVYKEGLGVDDLTAEFDAFRVIADALIERTRAEAE
jgi:hypothetical protein